MVQLTNLAAAQGLLRKSAKDRHFTLDSNRYGAVCVAYERLNAFIALATEHRCQDCFLYLVASRDDLRRFFREETEYVHWQRAYHVGAWRNAEQFVTLEKWLENHYEEGDILRLVSESTSERLKQLIGREGPLVGTYQSTGGTILLVKLDDGEPYSLFPGQLELVRMAPKP